MLAHLVAGFKPNPTRICRFYLQCHDDTPSSCHAGPRPQELDLYKKLQHKHVVGYIDASFEARTNTLFIFLEYVPGVLVSAAAASERPSTICGASTATGATVTFAAVGRNNLYVHLTWQENALSGRLLVGLNAPC